jgi:hypothetical protein
VWCRSEAAAVVVVVVLVGEKLCCRRRQSSATHNTLHIVFLTLTTKRKMSCNFVHNHLRCIKIDHGGGNI